MKLRGSGKYLKEIARMAKDQFNAPDHKEVVEGEVGEAKFRQFFAVHELEAWLLSDPGIFHRDVRKDFPATVKNPESVNFNQPPAQLLERLYQKKLGRPYKKIVDGRNLFGKLDPEIAYKKCLRLKEILVKCCAWPKTAETEQFNFSFSAFGLTEMFSLEKIPEHRVWGVGSILCPVIAVAFVVLLDRRLFGGHPEPGGDFTEGLRLIFTLTWGLWTMALSSTVGFLLAIESFLLQPRINGIGLWSVALNAVLIILLAFVWARSGV